MKCVKGIGFLWVAVFAAFFALSACDDSSSAGGDNGSGGNRGGIPDTVETFMELSDYDSGKSQKCVATYLTEYHNMAVCDGDNGWVIGTLIEKMDCDFSSSSAKSSDSKSNDPAEVTDDSSDSKDNPSSAGTSTKSSNSNSSGTTTKSSNSSAGKVNCSALLEGWSWDVPKECLFNPDIDYGTMTDERDGKVYRTVQIGDQVWMAENLNFDPGQGGSGDDKYDWSWCYNNEPKNCDVGGRLYTWAAAMDSVGEWSTNGKGCGYGSKTWTCSPTYPVRGICPKGWHLPENVEWGTLFEAVGGSNGAGTALKSQCGWYRNCTETDAFGFSVPPAGSRHGYNQYRNFSYDGSYAYFWCSTYYSNKAKVMYLTSGSGMARMSDNSMESGHSVRCVKDSD